VSCDTNDSDKERVLVIGRRTSLPALTTSGGKLIGWSDSQVPPLGNGALSLALSDDMRAQ